MEVPKISGKTFVTAIVLLDVQTKSDKLEEKRALLRDRVPLAFESYLGVDLVREYGLTG